MASKGGRMPETHEPGEYHFHYNREAREELLSEETKRVLTKTKLFTMNKRNMIILADIAVILLFTMIFAPFALGGRNNLSFQGYRTAVKAYEFDGSVLVSLRVEAKEETPLESGLINAVFTCEDSDSSVESVDTLPVDPEEPRILRAELPASGKKSTKVFVSVEINGKKRNLSIKARSE